MKKVLWILWGIAVVLFFVFTYMFFSQLKFTRYYNNGRQLYNEGNYSQAEQNFKGALFEVPSHFMGRQCKTRINLALSMVTPLTPESITSENFDDTIKKLESARDYLITDDCAHKDDENGHNKQAQILKDEIEKYIEELKKASQNANSGSSNQEEPENSQDDDESEEMKRLREEMNEIQREGMQERQEKLEFGSEYGNYDFYSGKNW